MTYNKFDTQKRTWANVSETKGIVRDVWTRNGRQ